MPAVTLDGAATNAWYHGRPITRPEGEAHSAVGDVRIYADRGAFAGVGQSDGAGRLTPSFVLLPAEGDRRS